MMGDDDARPRLDKVLYPHALRCGAWGCVAVVTWATNRGWQTHCDWHRQHWCDVVPVTVYGHEGDGWLSWPIDLRLWAALRARGARRVQE